MTIKNSNEQYDKPVDAIMYAEKDAPDGMRAQVQFNPVDGSVFVTHGIEAEESE